MSTAPVETVLPNQAPATLQEKILQVQQQRALLTQMRAVGDPQLTQEADALEEQYHARDMCALSEDVYPSAAHEAGSPGLGWIRVSEHPELLEERLGVHWSKQQIHEYLQPDNSDFRAEIYLPDPRVYGPDVTPVISTKGSNGLVAVPNGNGGIVLRESALEDWTENARQGVGLESDHADRAMKLATAFKRDFEESFENVGHSKGAVGATASAELTGMPAYIFNGAGLHPNTVARYVEQHGGIVHDMDSSIHSYHVKGEVLHDAQAGIHGMDVLTRAQVGLAARQLGELGQLSDVHAMARDRLAQALPYDPKMQHDALSLIDYLGSHSGAQILKGVPLPAGANQIELPAKMRDAQGQLVDRPQQPTLGEMGADAGPLMNVVSGALAGGIIGKHYGDAVAAGGRSFEQGTQWAGAGAQKGMEIYGYVLNADVQGHGRLVAGAMHYGGAAAADMRQAHGQVQATVDRGMGKLAQLSASLDGAVLRAGSHIPGLEGLRQVAAREAQAATAYAAQQHADAARAMAHAQHDADAIRRVADGGAATVVHSSALAGDALQSAAQRQGELINGGYRAVGASVRGATDRAPATGAEVGVATGAAVAVAAELEFNATRATLQTYDVFKHGKDSALEAVARHSAKDSLLPSFDAHTRQMENEGIERMQALQQSSSPHARQPLTPENNPNAYLQRMLESAHSGDWSAFRNDTQTLAAMQPGRDMHAQAVASVDTQQQQQAMQRASEQQQTMQQTAAQGMSR